MTARKHCPECEGTNLFTRNGISARGGYGPDLLPGASSLFTSPKMMAIVCKDCGLIRYFATGETLAKIGADRGWQRLL